MENIDLIRSHLSEEFDDTNESTFVEKRRLSELIEQYADVVRKIPAERAPLSRIDNLNSHLTGQVANQTEAYSTSGDGSHLKTANNELTTQLTELGILRSLIGDAAEAGQITTLNKLADEFVESVSKKLKHVDDTISKLGKKIDDLSSTQQQLTDAFAEKKQDVDQIVIQAQSDFAQSQQVRADEAKALANKLKQDFEVRFEELHSKHKKSLEKIVADAKSQTDALNSNSSQQLDEVVSDAREKHQAILELFELVAVDSVAAGYLRNAENEGSQANLWRWISVGFISAAVVWLLGVFIYTQITNSSGLAWTWYLPVFSLTIVLLGGAAYMAQQSTKHRMNEKRDRWFYLQMKAIDPFIRSLDDATQKELKKELTAKLFGNDRSESEPNVINEHAITSLTKMVTDILKASKT
ncbi:hypothetical protein WNZ14_23100 [Hoeflea sp. AS60]|uniref:hypothetical protein n=1 Tax=Hoeflea sp. AS60 TaxID=3135780 RepID=UPI00316B5EF2